MGIEVEFIKTYQNNRNFKFQKDIGSKKTLLYLSMLYFWHMACFICKYAKWQNYKNRSIFSWTEALKLWAQQTK